MAMSTTYNRAVDAVNGLEALRLDGLMSVATLGAACGMRNAYRLLHRLYRAAGRETTWTHTHAVPGLYYGRDDRLARPLRAGLFGGYGRI